MSEMVVRVRDAMHGAFCEKAGIPVHMVEPGEHSLEYARAAIEAMREPTDAMVSAARREANVNGMGPRGMSLCWRSAIDAALSDEG